jgi:gas vesicle protein
MGYTVIEESDVEYKQIAPVSPLISKELHYVAGGTVRRINGKLYKCFCVRVLKKKWFKPQMYELLWDKFKTREHYQLEQVTETMKEMQEGMAAWQDEIETWKTKMADMIGDLGMSIKNHQESTCKTVEKLVDTVKAHADNLNTLERRTAGLAIPRKRPVW